ncbi:MAG TPA: tetratricopeptide repeat protein [Gemmatimonadales bacterium]|jgi:tetratricopeptide (TPR) repeat protein|nr:tetratricopeptide repeat protein [Gemmatimonadales bacterium]
MKRQPDRPHWRELIRRHERLLTRLYLGAAILFVAAFTLPPLRTHSLWLVQRAITAWDNRWSRRVELGEALVRAGRYRDAESYLERLDRDFPARDVRHARDKERERLLVALGRSYAELGHKQKALDTYKRLVAFDPRNYRNYYALAVMSNRLLAGWAPAPEARDAFLQVLRLNPSHLPSVRGAIAFYSARGEFSEVVRLYRDYLDAYLRQEVSVTLGPGPGVLVEVPVDGQFHEYEVPLLRPAGWSGELGIAAGGFPFGLAALGLLPPHRVGVAETVRPLELPITAAKAIALTAVAEGSWRAEGAEAKLLVVVPPQPEGIATVRLRLRLCKPVDQATWALVVPAFHNLLDENGLAAAQSRTLLLPSSAGADSVLLWPRWATQGLGVGADDSRY